MSTRKKHGKAISKNEPQKNVTLDNIFGISNKIPRDKKKSIRNSSNNEVRRYLFMFMRTLLF